MVLQILATLHLKNEQIINRRDFLKIGAVSMGSLIVLAECVSNTSSSSASTTVIHSTSTPTNGIDKDAVKVASQPIDNENIYFNVDYYEVYQAGASKVYSESTLKEADSSDFVVIANVKNKSSHQFLDMTIGGSPRCVVVNGKYSYNEMISTNGGVDALTSSRAIYHFWVANEALKQTTSIEMKIYLKDPDQSNAPP